MQQGEVFPYRKIGVLIPKVGGHRGRKTSPGKFGVCVCMCVFPGPRRSLRHCFRSVDSTWLSELRDEPHGCKIRSQRPPGFLLVSSALMAAPFLLHRAEGSSSASGSMTSHSSQEGGIRHLRRQTSVLTLCRHLFAPGCTETHYTPSGHPQTTTLRSEVSSGQQTATKQLPLCPTLGSEATVGHSGGAASSKAMVSRDHWRPREPAGQAESESGAS